MNTISLFERITLKKEYFGLIVASLNNIFLFSEVLVFGEVNYHGDGDYHTIKKL